jgi:hypothetical protein
MNENRIDMPYDPELSTSLSVKNVATIIEKSNPPTVLSITFLKFLAINKVLGE